MVFSPSIIKNLGLNKFTIYYAIFSVVLSIICGTLVGNIVWYYAEKSYKSDIDEINRNEGFRKRG